MDLIPPATCLRNEHEKRETIMSLICHNFKKDVRQLRLVVGLWLLAIVVHATLGAIVPSTTGHPVLWIIYQLMALAMPMLQFVLMVVIIPMVIQHDPLVDTRAFWLTRPISRPALLAGKLLFLGVVIILPVVLGEMVVLAGSGLDQRHVLLAVPEVLLEVTASTCVIGVLAAFTSNFARFAITGVCYLVGWAIVSFVIGLLLDPILKHSANYPDMSTGALLSSKLSGWVVTSLLGGLILVLQYVARPKKATMVLAIVAVLCGIVANDLHPFLRAEKKQTDRSTSSERYADA